MRLASDCDGSAGAIGNGLRRWARAGSSGFPARLNTPPQRVHHGLKAGHEGDLRTWYEVFRAEFEQGLGGVVLGEEVSEVIGGWEPMDREVLLFHLVAHPMEAHVEGTGS